MTAELSLSEIYKEYALISEPKVSKELTTNLKAEAIFITNHILHSRYKEMTISHPVIALGMALPSWVTLEGRQKSADDAKYPDLRTQEDIDLFIRKWRTNKNFEVAMQMAHAVSYYEVPLSLNIADLQNLQNGAEIAWEEFQDFFRNDKTEEKYRYQIVKQLTM